MFGVGTEAGRHAVNVAKAIVVVNSDFQANHVRHTGIVCGCIFWKKYREIVGVFNRYQGMFKINNLSAKEYRAMGHALNVGRCTFHKNRGYSAFIFYFDTQTTKLQREWCAVVSEHSPLLSNIGLIHRSQLLLSRAGIIASGDKCTSREPAKQYLHCKGTFLKGMVVFLVGSVLFFKFFDEISDNETRNRRLFLAILGSIFLIEFGGFYMFVGALG